MNNIEKAVVLALVISPFTILRFGMLGIAEILLVFLFVKEFPKLQEGHFLKSYYFSKLWIVLLLLCFLGLLFHLLVFDFSHGTILSTLFDGGAYIMIFLTCITIESLINNKQINTYNILKYTFLCSGSVFTILYILSHFVDSILGLPLRYFGFFSPLALNLHQISMFITPLPFLGLFVIKREKSKGLKLICALFIITLSMMIIDTGSFKAYVGLIVGGISYLLFTLIKKNKENIIIKFSTPIIFTLIILYVLLNINTLSTKFMEIFSEEDIGDGRTYLYSMALDLFMKSPIIGFGPGSHIFMTGDFWDAHQTLLTIALQVGLVGLSFFIYKYIYLLVMLSKEISIFCATIPISIYLLGGDILRRLPIWIFLLLFFHFIYSKDNE